MAWLSRDTKFKVMAFGVLATVFSAASPVLASAGCRAFYGRVDDQTKGEGGNRVGAGFSKGDTLAVTISDAPGMRKQSANLLQYASPDGPSRAVVEDTSDSFSYTVPANTTDYIYLNFSGVNKGTIVT